MTTTGRPRGRPRSLTFDELVTIGKARPYWAADKANKNEGGTQLNNSSGKATYIVSNNLRTLKRLARQQQLERLSVIS